MIRRVTPREGPATGGTLVTITGDGYTPGTAVQFANTPATGVTVVDSRTITALTPANGPGPVTVTVTTPGGIATLPNAFTYRPVPAVTITGINPPAGPLAGGVVVTVTGAGFLPGATVTLGGRPATQVSVVDAQTITAITPRGRKGTVDLTVTNPDKTTATLPNAYTYQVAPTIRRVTPRQEPQSLTEPSSTSPDPGSSEAVAVPALPETHPEGPTSITSVVPDVIGNAAGK